MFFNRFDVVVFHVLYAITPRLLFSALDFQLKKGPPADTTGGPKPYKETVDQERILLISLSLSSYIPRHFADSLSVSMVLALPISVLA